MKTYTMENDYEPYTGQHQGIVGVEDKGGGDWVPAEVAQKLYDMLKIARHAAENDYACGEDLLEDIENVLAHAEGGEDVIR